MELLKAAQHHLSRVAVVRGSVAYRYEHILQASEQIGSKVSRLVKPETSGEVGPRIGLYATPGPEYVAATLAIHRAGGVVVPLATSHPPREHVYVLEDAGVSLVVAPQEAASVMEEVTHTCGSKLLLLDPSDFPGEPVGTLIRDQNQEAPQTSLPSAAPDHRGALIMYTSGTTGRPKGVLHTHHSLQSQVKCLSGAWGWVPQDVILHTLPLHHTHGIINALYCALYNGACVRFMSRFSPGAVWDHLLSGEISLFMGVPTMYAYLLDHYEKMKEEEKPKAKEAAAGLRLAISGSAACPVPIQNRWQALTGTPLLERYGMTETGMVLSNPLRGERRPGAVGLPLPGVEVKVIWEGDTSEGNGHPGGVPAQEGSWTGDDGGLTAGELRVKGPMIFKEYYNRPDATLEAFDEEGYFRTGDIVTVDGDPPYYRILGRASADIIKSGGYKISALHIESALLEHPGVKECSVVGVPDPALGERITALMVGVPGVPVEDQDLIRFCLQRLPQYQVPRSFKLVDALPRNAMGKINKKELLRTFFPQEMAQK